MVAILICAISLLMLSSAIYSAGNILDRSGQKMDEIYTGINNMETKTGTETASKLNISNGINLDAVDILICEDEATGLASYKRSTP